MFSGIRNGTMGKGLSGIFFSLSDRYHRQWCGTSEPGKLWTQNLFNFTGVTGKMFVRMLINLSAWLIVAICVAVVGYWVLISKACQNEDQCYRAERYSAHLFAVQFCTSWK